MEATIFSMAEINGVVMARATPALHGAVNAMRFDTFPNLLRYNHGLDCYCHSCRRWASTDLAMLVRNGLGDRQVHLCRPRCRKCSALGR